MGEILFFAFDPAVRCETYRIFSEGLRGEKSHIPETRGNPNCSPRPTTLLICEAFEGGSRDAEASKAQDTCKVGSFEKFCLFPFRISRFLQYRRRSCAPLYFLYTLCNFRPALSLSLWFLKLIFKGRCAPIAARVLSPYFFHFFLPFFSTRSVKVS